MTGSVSEPCYTNIKVVASAIKRDHRAIIATVHRPVISRYKRPTRVTFRRRTPHQHAALLDDLSGDDFDSICACEKDALVRLDKVYPIRKVTITSANPRFIATEISNSFEEKNRLLRAGRVEKASACACMVGKCIERATKAQL